MEYIKESKIDCERIKNDLLKIDNRIFFSSIAERGKEYFKSGKIKNLIKINDNTYSAIVAGSEYYDVTVKIKGISDIDAECTCPFNASSDNHLCKHIYATYMAICELENKKYLNNFLIKYTKKYNLLYLNLINESNKFKLNKADKNLYQKYIKEFINLYERTEKIIDTNFYIQTTLDNLCKFITKSGEIFDKLEQINNMYKEKTIESSKTNIKKSSSETHTDKSKCSFTKKFFKILFAIVSSLFIELLSIGADSSSASNDTSDNEDDLSYGDTVMVRYNGKIGVIVSKENNYYTVKLKDENENDYYASYSRDELDVY